MELEAMIISLSDIGLSDEDVLKGEELYRTFTELMEH